jgi:hypothetical protein
MTPCPHPPSRLWSATIDRISWVDWDSVPKPEKKGLGLFAWIACCDCGETIFTHPALLAGEAEWATQYKELEEAA